MQTKQLQFTVTVVLGIYKYIGQMELHAGERSSRVFRGGKDCFVGVVTTLYSRLVEDRNDGTDGGPADRTAPTHLNAPPAT